MSFCDECPVSETGCHWPLACGTHAAIPATLLVVSANLSDCSRVLQPLHAVALQDLCSCELKVHDARDRHLNRWHEA